MIKKNFSIIFLTSLIILAQISSAKKFRIDQDENGVILLDKSNYAQSNSKK